MTSDLEATQAVDPRGRKAEVDIPIRTHPLFITENLKEGIDLRIDGEVVARLVQPTRGLLRSRRIIRLDPVGSGSLPDGAFFRLRNWATVTLESPEGCLIRTPRLIPFGLSGIVRVADGVSADTVLVYTLIGQSGFGSQALSWP